MILDFTSDFKYSGSNENTVKRKKLETSTALQSSTNRIPLSNIENIVNNNNYNESDTNTNVKTEKVDISWINSQLVVMQLPQLVEGFPIHESTLQVIQTLISEKQLYQTSVMQVTRENEKLRNELTSQSTTVERLENSITSYKSEIQTLTNKISTLISEHRDEKRQWLDNKLDLTNKISLIQAQITHLYGSIKKKDKEFEKLQNATEKLLHNKTKLSNSSIIISKPLVKSITQSKNLLSLIEIESNSNKNIISSLQNKIIELNENIINLKSNWKENEQKLYYQIEVLKSRNQLVLENIINNNTNNDIIISSTPQLTYESNINTLNNNEKLENLNKKLIDAKKIIREQDKIIHQALFGVGISNISSDNIDLVDDIVTNYEFLDSNEIVKWTNDLQPTGLHTSPETIALLRRCGWNESDLPNSHEVTQISNDIVSTQK